MGTRIFTNGAWASPEGLTHYLAHHQLVLPEEFMAYALEPGHTVHDLAAHVEADEAFWLEWCAHTSND